MSKKKTASAKSGAAKNSRNKNKSSKGSSGNSSNISRKSGSGWWFNSITNSSDAVPLTDYASFTPGMMMVIMIGLIFVLDMFTTVMADSQYYDFRNVFRVFDYISIAVGLMFLIYKAVKKELGFCLRDAFFAGFMLCIIISTCINGLTSAAAFGLPIRYIGIFNMFAFFIIYMKVSGYISRVSFRYSILLGYIFAADAVALSVLYDQYIGEIAAYQNKIGISALFANSNHYGYFLCMAVLVAIGCFIYEQGWKSLAGAVSALLNLLVLVLNNTLGAILAVGICTAGLVIINLVCDRENQIKTRKVLGMTAMFLICAAGAFAVSSGIRDSVFGLIKDVSNIISGSSDGTEGSGRLSVWKTVCGYISKKPLFGYGCEGITSMLIEDSPVGDTHCEPMSYAAYYGIPAALLYLAGICTAAIRYFRSRAKLPSYCRIAFLAASGYFLSSLVGVPMFYTAPFFFIFMGMAAEDYKGIKSKN